MPYSIEKSIVTFLPTFKWWLDPASAAEEAEYLPWLKKEPDATTTLCQRCRWIDFSFFFTNPDTQNIFVEGRKWPTDNPRKLGTLRHLQEGRKAGCEVCKLLHDETCQLFKLKSIPDSLPLDMTAGKHSNTTIASSEVWCQLYPRNISILPANPYLHIKPSSSSAFTRSTAKVTFSEILNFGVPGSWENYGRQSFHVSLLHHDEGSKFPPGTTRLVSSTSETMDFNLVVKWLADCQRCHPGHTESACPTVLETITSRGHLTMFIDVQNLCLVERVVRETKYAALSYVWGKDLFFRNTSIHDARLRQKHGLEAYLKRIPRTIREALLLCQNIGIQYLWADALCIVQDTYGLREQIVNMNTVFSEALVTIVAASGQSADAGLPGVLPFSRNKHQATASVEFGFTITRTLSGENISDHSFWNTRGWTFQEKLLSQRMVVFSSDQIRLYCRHGSQTESSVVNIHDHPERLTCTSSRELSHSVQGHHGVDFEIYNNVVRKYTERDLTFDSDILNAFSGLMPVLAGKFTSGDFCYGLPVCLIDIALLWRPRGFMDRRNTKRYHFPSWSWCGWKGAVEYTTSRLLWERTSPRIRWVSSYATNKDAKEIEDEVIFPQEVKDWTVWKPHRDKSEQGAYYVSNVESTARRHCRPGLLRSGFRYINIDCMRLIADVARFRISNQLHTLGRSLSILRPSKWDHNRPISTLRVMTSQNYHAGYVVVDGNTLKNLKRGRRYLFVCISASVEEEGEHDAAWDEATHKYAGLPGNSAINRDFVPRCKAGWAHVYDHNQFPCDTCWCLYNVLMISDSHERLGVGQIHAEAFDTVSKKSQDIILR